MSDFVRLTSREVGGGDLFLRKDMVAAVGSYWNGKQQVTHVTLINEDIDYEVKESVRDVLRLITGKDADGIPGKEDKSVGLAGHGDVPQVPADAIRQAGVKVGAQANDGQAGQDQADPALAGGADLTVSPAEGSESAARERPKPAPAPRNY